MRSESVYFKACDFYASAPTLKDVEELLVGRIRTETRTVVVSRTVMVVLYVNFESRNLVQCVGYYCFRHTEFLRESHLTTLTQDSDATQAGTT